MPRIEGTKQGTDDRGREIWRPIAVISILVSGKGKAQGPAVIDSGADLTIVPFEIVAGLGVEWDKLKKIGFGLGAGGKFERRQLEAEVYFREWKVCDEIEVSQPGTLTQALLGRDDFFRHFVVRFAWHKQPPELYLDPIVQTPKKRR